jgi:hypothetical protein
MIKFFIEFMFSGFTSLNSHHAGTPILLTSSPTPSPSREGALESSDLLLSGAVEKVFLTAKCAKMAQSTQSYVVNI